MSHWAFKDLPPKHNAGNLFGAPSERPLSECDKIVDKEQRLGCKFRVLHSITKKQDHVNLNIRSDLNDDKDPRWIPIHMIDDANAIILEISQAEGYHMKVAYITEKIDNLQKKLFTWKWRRDFK